MNSKEADEEEKSLSWADTKRMPMTSRVIQETMRVASILSFTFREAVQDVELEGGFTSSSSSSCFRLAFCPVPRFDLRLFGNAGYLIPKGWKVMPLFRNIHHSPDNFPNPEKFDPSRFEVREMR